LTAPLVEESSKCAGLILPFLLARNHARSAYDGLLLGAVAAGFLLAAMIIHGSLDAVVATGGWSVALTVVAGTSGIVFAWRFAERRQRTWIGVLLADDVAAGTITADELRALTGRRKDRKAYLKAKQGRREARHARHVLGAAADLAARIAATDDPLGPDAVAARAELPRVRTLRGP
jgi:hypothetical protein